MSFLTLFTAPKPFADAHIATIQRNAIRSWLHLDEEVQVLLIGQEDGMAETAAELGVVHLPHVARNQQNTPLVSSIFSLARENSSSPMLAYLNADILLLPDFAHIARQVSNQLENFLVVGQRWDLAVKQELDFSPGWETRLNQQLEEEGRLHPPGGSDYFIFPRSCFTDMPPFAIGRAGWDNWMFFHARQQGWAVVNATESLRVIHQDHDYSHLPGGVPHYRLPETGENVRLAGGRRMIFTLFDADHQLVDGMVRPIRMQGSKLWREIEIYPLVRLKSPSLAQVFFAFFHPLKALREWRAWLRRKLRSSITGLFSRP
jgi:hypothetical protein